MKFSREFDFADCRYFAFRGNKFSQTWILHFTAGSNFHRAQASSGPVFALRYLYITVQQGDVMSSLSDLM